MRKEAAQAEAHTHTYTHTHILAHTRHFHVLHIILSPEEAFLLGKQFVPMKNLNVMTLA